MFAALFINTWCPPFLGTVEGSVPDDLDFLNIKSFILVFDVLTFESLFSEPSLIRCIVSKLDPELFDIEVACGILYVALFVLEVLLKLLTRLLLRLECWREDGLGLVLAGLVSDALCNDDLLEVKATFAAMEEVDDVRLGSISSCCGWILSEMPC